MSALFDSARQDFLEGNIAYLTDTIRVALADHNIVVPSLASDVYFADLVYSGTGDSFTNISPTVTELTDAAAAFNASMVGRYITIAGSTTPANDGTFLITAVPSGTQIRYANSNPGVTEGFAGTWSIAGLVGNAGGSLRSDMPALAGRTSTGGVADASDVIITAIPLSSDLSSIILFQDTGVDATSRLIAQIDVGTGLPFMPNGGDVTITWSNGADKIFKL